MKEFKNGENVIQVTKDPSENVVMNFEAYCKPKELTDEEKKSSVETEIKKEKIKEYVKDLKTMKSNLKKMYNLVYGNCTDSVQTMLKAENDFEVKSKVFDYKWIFLKVKLIVSGLDTKVNLRVSLHTAISNYMLMKQFQYESNDAYLTRFKSMVQTLKIAGCEHILVSTKIMGKEIKDITNAEINDEKEQFMAACYILRSDDNRFKRLLEDLKRSANLGRDEYPKTLTEAFNLLMRELGEYDTVRQPYNRFRGRATCGGRGNPAFMFAQQGGGDINETTRFNDRATNKIVAGTNSVTHRDISCYRCRFKGYYRNQCPYEGQTGVVAMHFGCLLTQGQVVKISKSWILSDSYSTCDVSNNVNFVSNIKECNPEDKMTAFTNGGEQEYTHFADLKLLPITVHFKKDSMATILSFKTVMNILGAELKMDSSVSNDIMLTLQANRCFVFKQFQNGLYVYDTDTSVEQLNTKTKLPSYSLVQSVAENKLYFTAREIKGADTSRQIQEYLYHPSTNL